ncbi:MAG TPA: RNA methyltransferase [Casimicrobiaceae bacterium]|nr:RNA methyltransferase [Casimicrobiaceae bacterium]
MPRVTSRQNPRLKELAGLLASARDRRKSGRCVLEGEHIVGVYLDRGGRPDTVAVSDDALERAGVRAILSRVHEQQVLVVPRRLFAELAALPADVGILAVIATPQPTVPEPAAFHLLLEDVQDPGNVGSMLRSAAAAGVDQVLLSRGCAFAWAPKTLRAAQGAHFLTTIVENVDLREWARSFRQRGGRIVASVVASGRSVYDCRLDGPIAVVVGNEGGGLSDALLACADTRATIPMPGGMESLNAAAAAAVMLFESVRQRQARKSDPAA